MSNSFLYDSDSEFPDLTDGNYDVYLNKIRIKGISNTLIGVDSSGYIVPGEFPSDVFVRKDEYDLRQTFIDEEFDEIKTELENIDDRISTNESDIVQIQSEINVIENDIQEIRDNQESILSEINDIQDEQKTQNEAIQILENKTVNLTITGSNVNNFNNTSLANINNLMNNGVTNSLNLAVRNNANILAPNSNNSARIFYHENGLKYTKGDTADYTIHEFADKEYIDNIQTSNNSRFNILDGNVTTLTEDIVDVKNDISDINTRTNYVNNNSSNILITGTNPVFSNLPSVDNDKLFENYMDNNLTTKAYVDEAVFNIDTSEFVKKNQAEIQDVGSGIKGRFMELAVPGVSGAFSIDGINNFVKIEYANTLKYLNGPISPEVMYFSQKITIPTQEIFVIFDDLLPKIKYDVAAKQLMLQVRDNIIPANVRLTTNQTCFFSKAVAISDSHSRSSFRSNIEYDPLNEYQYFSLNGAGNHNPEFSFNYVSGGNSMKKSIYTAIFEKEVGSYQYEIEVNVGDDRFFAKLTRCLL